MPRLPSASDLARVAESQGNRMARPGTGIPVGILHLIHHATTIIVRREFAGILMLAFLN